MRTNIVKLDNSMPREKWVKRISTAWRESLTSIFETGNLLEAAKAELKHGEWGAMFQKLELPFGRNTAFRLINIAQNDNLRNVDHSQHLPVSWPILYDLTKLTDEQFDNGIKSGAINPQMQRKDVRALRGIEPKEPKKKEEAALDEPKTGDEWRSFLWEGLSKAARTLPANERTDLFTVLRQHIDNLERKAAERDLEKGNK